MTEAHRPTMYCIECGQAQPVHSARYCPFCGTALFRPTAERASPEPSQGDATQGDQGIQPSADGQPRTDGHQRSDAPADDGATVNAAPSDAPSPARPLVAVPVESGLAVTLDPSRWVPLDSRIDQLRSRIRWALRAGVVLAVILGGAAAWWWVSTTQEAVPEEGVEVERLEVAPKQPS